MLHLRIARSTLPKSVSHAVVKSTRNVGLRRYSSSPEGSSKSPHAQFYSDLVPGMIPIALLGSAVYLGLRLAQAYLSHDKYMKEARARVRELEEEVLVLRQERSSAFAQPKSLAQVAEKSGSRWWFW